MVAPAETSFLGQAGLLPSRMSWLLKWGPFELPGPYLGLLGVPHLYITLLSFAGKHDFLSLMSPVLNFPFQTAQATGFFLCVCVLDHDFALKKKKRNKQSKTVTRGKCKWVKALRVEGPN